MFFTLGDSAPKVDWLSILFVVYVINKLLSSLDKLCDPFLMLYVLSYHEIENCFIGCFSMFLRLILLKESA